MKNTQRVDNRPKIDNLLKTMEAKKNTKVPEKVAAVPVKKEIKSPAKRMKTLDKIQVVVPQTNKTPTKMLAPKKAESEKKKEVKPKTNINPTNPMRLEAKQPIKMADNSVKNNDSMKELKNLLKKEIVAAVEKKKTSGSSQQQAFLKVIENKKAKGVEPIFTITQDFKVEMQIGQGAFAVVHRC